MASVQRCRPREGRGLHRMCHQRTLSSDSVAVPVRGAGCILVGSIISSIIAGLPSPRGVRVASEPHGHRDRLRRGCRPREGCGLYPMSRLEERRAVFVSCRPREGCGLHRHLHWADGRRGRRVAVPVRGAGCISATASRSARASNFDRELPSPRGVRVASWEDCDAFKQYYDVAVPARGAGCICTAGLPARSCTGCRPHRGGVDCILK